MKIYNKSAFVTGVFCAGLLPLFALDILHADGWQWLISIAISAKLLYVGLSEAGSKREKILKEKYKVTAISLYGRFYFIKTNLPWIILGAFFAISLTLRFVFYIFFPIWIHAMFLIFLTIAVAYSIGIDRSIEEYIVAHTNKDNISNDFTD
ncbi:hypothetical protein EDC19_2544 [Natranaerovirga hydrolytica]|uniref:Uncharacterized protein n=1 Tax=Natranaerovirga hydrolytica TaxID=680378 RepID=A0A4R1MG65_9FIRM|nr:hypothetical protein [Natranaerovirga hydrolytica]TCK89129.1 hypothetical protein EDC19_2544 [Natranaerovirga hydrolytica]